MYGHILTGKGAGGAAPIMSDICRYSEARVGTPTMNYLHEGVTIASPGLIHGKHDPLTVELQQFLRNYSSGIVRSGNEY